MRQPKYSVNLSEEEIGNLRAIEDDPKTSKTRRIKAEILLDLDGKRAGYTVACGLASMYCGSIALVYNLMERYGREVSIYSSAPFRDCRAVLILP